MTMIEVNLEAEKMKKKICIIGNGVLLTCFFLAMTGFNLFNHELVSGALKEDWVFFVIYAVVFLWFLLSEKIGKYVLNTWLIMWFMTQFFFHWYYTFFSDGQRKIDYFQNTIKLIEDSNHYIPDLYHLVLHALILMNISLLSTYILKRKFKSI